MTTHLTKIWWDLNKDKLVEQAIPEAEIYKREWVGLTDEEVVDLKMLGRDLEFISMTALRRFARDIEQTLKEKNHDSR